MRPSTRAPLRFLTCGSVDDGKSTLIGRLLFDAQAVYEDQLHALAKDSRRYGSSLDELDFSLLVDGLQIEREQRITVDVAYRYFRTGARSFIVADTPGHEQYTRNMATGASTSDLAVLLVDARKGLLEQTLRHTHIVQVLGIKHVILAVNKMDLVGFDQAHFRNITAAYGVATKSGGFSSVTCIPVCARDGDNVVRRSSRMPWYQGLTLLEHLEGIDIDDGLAAKPFRFLVQWINRPNQDFRGYSGMVLSGTIETGQEVVVAASDRRSTVRAIVTAERDLTSASAGECVTLLLDDHIDVGRGDLFAAGAAAPHAASQLASRILWLADDDLLPGRTYLIKIGARTASASVMTIRHRLDIATLRHTPARSLHTNDIGFCTVDVSQRVAFDPYDQNRSTGSFVLIDRYSNRTVGAGMVEFGLLRADTVHAQKTAITKDDRAALKRHKPCILWFTGLSGSGKSTIANIVEADLHRLGVHTYLLDGDNVRKGLSRDLGFTDADRVENVRRVGEVARLFLDAGIVVICALISPFRAERRMVREMVPEGEFIEIFVDTPLELCRQRDPKGLYAKALAGNARNVTGIDSPYEEPQTPELRLETVSQPAEELAAMVVEYMRTTRKSDYLH